MNQTREEARIEMYIAKMERQALEAGLTAEEAARIKGEKLKQHALDCYLENLNLMLEHRDSNGLPEWQRKELQNCKDILPDLMCDLVQVPRSSTVGYSIRCGIHLADIGL